MKKKDAIRYFNELYDATYDDALTFIAGKAGDTDIAEDVLFDTYSEVFAYLQKQKKEHDPSGTASEFYRALNDAIERHKKRSTEVSGDVTASDRGRVEALKECVLDLSEQRAKDDMLVKKAHSYVLQRSSTERKAFILYFYEGYSAEKTAELLGLTEKEVYGYLEKTVSGIQNNFLAKYVIK